MDLEGGGVQKRIMKFREKEKVMKKNFEDVFNYHAWSHCKKHDHTLKQCSFKHLEDAVRDSVKEVIGLDKI